MSGLASPLRFDKEMESADAAVADLRDGATILVGGFGGAGFPFALREALIRRRLKGITIVSNNADFGGLAYDGGLTKIIFSFPGGATSKPVLQAIEDGRVELELTPQGTIAERVRAGGAGLGGVLTPTGVGTQFERGCETVTMGGRKYLIAPALRGDVALIRAHIADRGGNLFHRHASRNFNPLMAMAADLTIAEVSQIVELGELDPQIVHTPGAFVDRIVVTG